MTLDTRHSTHDTLPRIGITARSNDKVYFDGWVRNYWWAITWAGGQPVLLTPETAALSPEQHVAQLDGLLLSGGGDVHPKHYKERIQGTEKRQIHDGRDTLELGLARAALAADLPILGVCRGFQVLNVALGGSLYEDILDQKEGTLKHDYYPDYPRNLLSHGVEIEPASHLAQILGLTAAQVNSLHHQGVRQLASRLTATAHAPDGMLEAYELPAHRFGLAVQWHPEWLQAHAPMRRLFEVFVEEAKKPDR